MLITKTAVPVKERRRATDANEDEVPFVLLLANDGPTFERGKDRSFGLGEPKAGLDERIDNKHGIDGQQEFY